MKTFCRRNGLAALITGTVVVASLTGIPAANAQLANPGFETALTGWSRVVAPLSSGNWSSQTGAVSPVSGATVAAPVEGNFAAMTDGTGPGAQVLFQNFVVPASVDAATLSFSYTINNAAGVFFTGSDLTFNRASPNQQARVDILRVGADAFSVAGTDVLLNIFQTNPGDAANTGTYAFRSTDLTALFQAHPGETLRLRFAEADNLQTFNFGIDSVQLSTRIDAVGAVPEPSAYGVFGVVALFGLVAWKRLRGVSQAV